MAREHVVEMNELAKEVFLNSLGMLCPEFVGPVVDKLKQVGEDSPCWHIPSNVYYAMQSRMEKRECQLK